MNMGLLDVWKREWDVQRQWRIQGKSRETNRKDVWERPETRPWPTRTDVGLCVTEVRTDWLWALCGSLSLFGKHSDNTIIHVSRDSEKRQCQKIFDHFFLESQKNCRALVLSQGIIASLCLVPKRYHRLDDNSLLFGTYHIRGWRKMVFVSRPVGTY